MEKRLLFAVALSMLVLLVWSALFPKPLPLKQGAVIQPLKNNPLPSPGPIEQPALSPLVSLSTGGLELVFIEQLGAIKEAQFDKYQSYKFPLKYGFVLDGKELVFRKERLTSQEAVFVHQDQEKKIVKRFILSNSNYSMQLEIEIENLSSSPINLNLPVILGVLNFAGDQNRVRFLDIPVALKEKTLHLNGRKDMTFDQLQFIGLRDRYFCLIVEPGSECGGFVKKINANETEVGLTPKGIQLAPGMKEVQKFHIYLGPQELQLINNIKPEWSGVIYYGTFDFISHLLLQLLGLFYHILHNWGLAIILLSLAVYLVLFPFSLKQMRSMKEMQALQPHIEELRRTYKDNPQRLNKEMMELYKKHKVNPFSGCLPLILQMPIFFALYQALMRSVLLKGAGFLWIKDLSEPDRLFSLPATLPIREINLLPILMTIIMFIQQKMSVTSSSSTTMQQQKAMMIIMPIMFGLIFYNMPSGLVLYWFINSLLMLIFQVKISQTK